MLSKLSMTGGMGWALGAVKAWVVNVLLNPVVSLKLDLLKSLERGGFCANESNSVEEKGDLVVSFGVSGLANGWLGF